MLRIPETFGARFADGKPAAIQLYADGSDSKAGKSAARVRNAIATYSALV